MFSGFCLYLSNSVIFLNVVEMKFVQIFTFACAYINSGCALKLVDSSPFFLLGDGAASERAETKEKRSDKNRSKRLEISIECLELHLVEATENEKGEGVVGCSCAGEYAAVGETPAIDPQIVTSLSFIESFIL